ncbi:MAG: SURF1 family protein [Hydrogenophaga sp.]|uniref:SURF1 family protein n=1 Tax=Hydrogenophaga sp. TaxID=1904254 RepID=UPI003D9BF847
MSPPARRSGRFWLGTLATLLTMALTTSLGLWQLARAAQKQALQDGIAAQGALAAWSTRELLASARPADALHRPVDLTGRWVAGANVFLDNRPMGGRTGFVLLTPLRLDGSDRAVLVQRGWVPRDFLDRNKLPDVSTPADVVQVQGRLAPPPSQLFELGVGPPGAIRQNVDLSALAGEWGVPLLEGVSILQTGPQDTRLQRDWPRFVGDAHKHYGYAVQWFAMCATAAALYLWFQILLPRSRRRTHGTDPR